MELKNPVIAASGTFGFGREYDEFYDVGGLGGISVKGLTRLPRLGNPPHRITETPAGMLNSVGLQNPGVEAFLEKDLPWLLEKGAVVVANAAGSTEDDYCYMAERLSGTGIHILEMNISCPNVKEGGVAFGTKPESVYKITKAVRAHCTKPLMVKLSPNVADIAEVALAAQEGGADAISLINTLTGMAVDVRTRRPVLANVVGGLSGPAVRPGRPAHVQAGGKGRFHPGGWAWAASSPGRTPSPSCWSGARPCRWARQICTTPMPAWT